MDPDAPSERLALLLAYDGTAYHGWQIQPGAPTVQGLLLDALRPIAGGEVRVVGASRTDAGVHALGQVASVEAPRPLAPRVAMAALNATLPRDVRVLAACAAPASFDARRSARLKRYGYLLGTAAVPSPFLRAYAWHVGRSLDVPAMAAGVRALRGRHDFAAFCAAPGRGRDPVCHVYALRVVARERAVGIVISADSFLHHMVRNIAGSLVEVGLGRQRPGWVQEVLASRDRRAAGPTAPPQGLFLLRVRYGSRIVPAGRSLGLGRPSGASGRGGIASRGRAI